MRLPDDIAKVYDITDIVPGPRFITKAPQRIAVDLSKIGLEKAKKLAKLGYLKEKEVVAPKAKYEKPKKSVEDGNNE